MPKINLRWLAGVVFIPVVLAVLLFFLHQYQMGRNAHVFMREAKRAQTEDRPDDALNYLRRYIKLAPKDAEGLILYGFELADQDQLPQAFNALDRAIQKAPGRLDVRRRLVTICLKIARYHDAIEHLENHLLPDSPNDGELLEQLASAQIGLSEFAEAEITLERAMKDAPKRLEPYVLMASIQASKLGNLKGAMETLNQMVANNSDNAKAYSFRSQWLFRHFLDSRTAFKSRRGVEFDVEATLKQIDSDVREALRLAPEDIESLILAAQIAQQTDRLEEARKLIQDGLEKHPSNPQFYTMLSALEADAGNMEASIEAIRRGVELIPKNLDLQWNLARLLIESRQFDAARNSLAQIRLGGFTDALVEYLEGRMSFLQGDWSKAIETFENVRPRLIRWPVYLRHVDFWLGTAYREINSPDQQLASFRRAVASDPDWDAARLALAESLAAADQITEAINELQTVCASSDAPVSAHVALAKLLLRQNLLLPANRRSWGEFDAVLKKIDADGSQEATLVVLRMQRQLVTQDYTGAVQSISAARESHKDQIDLWSADFDLALAGRDRDRVNEIVRGAEEQFGDVVAVRLMKARALVAQNGGSPEAITELRSLSAPLPEYSAQDRQLLAEGLASLFLLANDFEDAERLALQISTEQPNNLRIRLLLLDIARRAKRLDLMEGVLNEIRRVVGEGAVWHYGEAERLVLKAQETNDVEAWSSALGHLEKARAIRPTWERIPLLTAEIHDRRGDAIQAISKYLEAIRMGERSPTVASRALTLLIGANRFDDAEKLIQQLKDSQSVFTVDMVKSEIAVELQRGRKDQVRKMVAQLVSGKSNFKDPLWLGQVYLNVDNYPAAIEQFRIVTAVEKNRPQAWIGLVRALVQNKQIDQAEATIAEAQKTLEADQVDLVLAQCYDALGNKDLAQTHFQQALKKAPEDSELTRRWIEFLVKWGAIKEAEVAIREMLQESSGKPALNQQTRLWLRRNLVIALLTYGQREAVAEALVQIDKNLAEVSPATVEDLRLKANIYARGANSIERRQAIMILEDLINQERPGEFQPDDHWLLASLYQMEGDLKKWRSELRRSISDRKEDPRFLAAFVKLNLMEKEIPQAEVYLETLERLVPNDLLTLDLKAQVLFARNRYHEVATLLKKVGTQEATPDERPDAATFRKYWAAKQFETYSTKLSQDKDQADLARQFAAEATSFYEQLIVEKPDLILAYAEFLAVTEQVARSLELLQEHFSEATVAQVTGITRKVMRNKFSTSDQLAVIQRLVEQKLKENPDSVALLLALTDLMSWRGDYEGAMKIYRDMLASNPKNTIALNNLAYVLALTGGSHREALSLIDKAIEYGGRNEAFLDTKGMVYLAAGHSDKAVLEFEKAIDEKETAEEQYHAAVGYSRTDRLKEAKDALQRAVQLGLVERDLHPIERQFLNKLKEQLHVDVP
ncbi:tetratricopeptide repeat protein [Schlesneria sp.]|uniref:tetratricopeptide repeat protein n=1 Tax=Schlesneria sp. TaxID=2762018 RepID=UPI002EE43A33